MSPAVPARAARGALAVAAILVAGCGSGAAPHGASPPATSPSVAPPRAAPRRAAPPSVAAGRRLFASQHCGDCHALAAAGARGGSGPDFDTSERLTRAQLRAALTEGANGMPSYAGRLAPAQLDAVAAFLLAATRR